MKKIFAILMTAIMALSMLSFASADGGDDITGFLKKWST